MGRRHPTRKRKVIHYYEHSYSSAKHPPLHTPTQKMLGSAPVLIADPQFPQYTISLIQFPCIVKSEGHVKNFNSDALSFIAVDWGWKDLWLSRYCIADKESYGNVMSSCTLDTKSSFSTILCVDIKPKDVERRENLAFRGN